MCLSPRLWARPTRSVPLLTTTTTLLQASRRRTTPRLPLLHRRANTRTRRLPPFPCPSRTGPSRLLPTIPTMMTRLCSLRPLADCPTAATPLQTAVADPRTPGQCSLHSSAIGPVRSAEQGVNALVLFCVSHRASLALSLVFLFAVVRAEPEGDRVSDDE